LNPIDAVFESLGDLGVLGILDIASPFAKPSIGLQAAWDLDHM